MHLLPVQGSSTHRALAAVGRPLLLLAEGLVLVHLRTGRVGEAQVRAQQQAKGTCTLASAPCSSAHLLAAAFHGVTSSLLPPARRVAWNNQQNQPRSALRPPPACCMLLHSWRFLPTLRLTYPAPLASRASSRTCHTLLSGKWQALGWKRWVPDGQNHSRAATRAAVAAAAPAGLVPARCCTHPFRLRIKVVWAGP